MEDNKAKKLEVKNLTKIFETPSSTVTAISGVDLYVKESEFTMIVGPSGCGKTTLLKSIVNDKIKIKAAGGIRDIECAKAMFAAGANLIGTSAGVQLLNSYENK